jgi:hypothetical protein
MNQALYAHTNNKRKMKKKRIAKIAMSFWREGKCGWK